MTFCFCKMLTDWLRLITDQDFLLLLQWRQYGFLSTGKHSEPVVLVPSNTLQSWTCRE